MKPLSKKHRCPQVKIMNTLSIPLPETDTEEDTVEENKNT